MKTTKTTKKATAAKLPADHRIIDLAELAAIQRANDAIKALATLIDSGYLEKNSVEGRQDIRDALAELLRMPTCEIDYTLGAVSERGQR